MSRCVSIISSFIAVLFLLGVVGGVADASQADGPRVESLAFIPNDPLAGQATIRLVLDKPLHPGSIQADVVSVSTIDLSDANAPWLLLTKFVTYDSISNTINVVLPLAPLPGLLVRVILLGTGPAPVLGTNGVPLGVKGSKDTAGKDYVNTFIAP